MPKQVIEPEIVSQGQVEPRHKTEENNRTNTKIYYSNNVGCLGFVIAAFSIILAIPLLVFGAFRRKK